MSQLNHKSETPLYEQLIHVILDSIRKDELGAGDKIQTEDALSKQYGVSKVTIRRALSELVKSGVLIRKQGKGTFICGNKLNEQILENRSFTELAFLNCMTPSTKLISVTLQVASEHDISVLKINPMDSVLFIERIRYVDGRPVMFESNYFPETYAGIMRHDLNTESIYSILASDFGIVNLRPTKTIEICYLTEREAKYLVGKRGDPAILVRELIFDANNKPVHHTRQVIIGDGIRFEII